MHALADAAEISAAPELPALARGPLRVRRRPDLEVARHEYLGRTSYLVKEPLSLKYHRFNEEEYALFSLLDGCRPWEAIQREFQRRFPERQVTLAEVQPFLNALHRANLVLLDVPGEGQRLHARWEQRRRVQRFAWLGNLLSIRFRGFDPQGLLEAVYPAARWFLTPLAVCLCLLLGLAALVLATVRFEDFAARLPTMHEFFGPANIFYLALVLTCTKVAHELGHALVARHFGARCHEMGVLLLVFTPCLYCNVSDAWMLPSKWQRAAIGAAGVYVELVLASAATFLWWFSEAGLFNHLCLNVMFVCSVTTLLFNANPLLRYDAYYVLADVAEIPNLRQKSQDYVARLLWRALLGLQLPADPFLPPRRKWFLLVYGVASTIYRWFITISILWFLHVALRPHRLEVLGQLLAAVTILGMVLVPWMKLMRLFWNARSAARAAGNSGAAAAEGAAAITSRLQGAIHVNKLRLILVLAGLTALAAAAFTVPIPYHVACPLQTRYRDAVTVYAELPGTLEEVLVAPGQRVEAGAPLARLRNLDMELAIVELEGRVKKLAAELDDLRQRRIKTPDVSVHIPLVEESLALARSQLSQRREDARRLTLRAPRGGVVLRAGAMPAPPPGNDTVPRSWHGDLFEPRNLGCHVAMSTPFCQIGEPAELEAVLVIDQEEVELVQPGDPAAIKLLALPGDVFRGPIVAIASKQLLAAPRQLSQKAGGALPTHTAAGGVEQPLSTAYAAVVAIDDPRGVVRDGFRGTAKVRAGAYSLAWRADRYLQQTFRFK